jgi:hypothetical protein
MQPIRVFVGTDVNGGCAECQMVFEYSLRKHASKPVEVVWMKISDEPDSFWYGWNTDTWSTPFSGFRYGIAEACEFKGRAIYCDDDQLWLDDVVHLFNQEIFPEDVMTGKILPNGEIRHCVSVIDCKKFGNEIQGGEDGWSVHRRNKNSDFVEMMKARTFPLTTIIDDRWNCYDGENMSLDDVGILHFTDMRSNPGVHMAVDRLGGQAHHWYDGPVIRHRRQDCVDIFKQYYDEAIAAGYSVADYVPNRQLMYKKQSQALYIANNGYDVSQGQ